MRHQKTNLDEAIRMLVDEEQVSLVGEPPSREELLAYQNGSLAGEAVERVRRYLVLDAATTATYFDLQEQQLAQQRREDWKALLSKAEFQGLTTHTLTRDSCGDSNFSRNRSGTLRSPDFWFSKPRLPWLLAAGWLLTAVGLGFWIYRIERAASEGSVELASVAAAPIETQLLLADLFSEATIRRADTQEPELELTPRTQRVVLFLNLAAATSLDRCRAVLRDGADVVRFTVDDLQRQPAGNFVIALDPGSLTAGHYELAIYDPANDASISPGEPITRFPFSVSVDASR